MQYTIRSGKLTAVIDSFGAELCSLKDMNGREYIWTAEDVWKRHAPLLFPFVCNTSSKKYTVNGNEYSISNHGFTRDTDFPLAECGDDKVMLSYRSDESTLAHYPYPFEFSAEYALSENVLKVTLTVTNTGKDDMPFFIGGHPGFLCPFDGEPDGCFEDYDVVYEKNETIVQSLPEKKVTVLENGNSVHVSRKLFENDVFMKDKPESSFVSLVSRKSERAVTVKYDRSGCIAVWSPYDDRAGFVCLEPWAQAPVYCCDTEELTEMPHAQRIAAGEKYSFSFEIGVKE